MSTFYGSDSYCITDLQLIDLQVTDPRQLIGQRIARRLQTPRGALGLINDDPDFGWDVRQYVNAKLLPGDILVAQQQIQFECLKDEQVQSAVATMTISNGSVVITLSLTAATGPFLLTLNVNQLTVDAVFSFQ